MNIFDKTDDKKDLERIFELISYSSTHHILKAIDNMLCDHPDYNERIGIKCVSNLSNEFRDNIYCEIKEYWDKAVDEQKTWTFL